MIIPALWGDAVGFAVVICPAQQLSHGFNPAVEEKIMNMTIEFPALLRRRIRLAENLAKFI